jgi:hydroxyacylglutathione hydrolase
MMKALIFTLFFLQIISLNFAQNAVETTNGWYQSKQIGVKTWVINEPGIDDNMYLLEGRDSALLIDAGFGLGNLRDFVKSLTPKPLIVVNTHFHPDHTGGNYQFPKVHIAAADWTYAKPFLNFRVTKQIASMVIKDIAMADSLRFSDTLGVNTTILVPIKDNYVFKLGKRDVKVIAVPGHSPGSIFMLDRKNKFLFTGDNTIITWLFFEESLPVETYLQSLQKLSKFKGQFNLLLAGHGAPTKIDILDELSGCCQQILNGKSEAKPYHSFIGQDGVSCTYKTVTIAYDPKKINVKKGE